MAVLLLCCNSIASYTSYDDTSASAICHLWRGVSIYCIQIGLHKLPLVSSVVFPATLITLLLIPYISVDLNGFVAEDQQVYPNSLLMMTKIIITANGFYITVFIHFYQNFNFVVIIPRFLVNNVSLSFFHLPRLIFDIFTIIRFLTGLVRQNAKHIYILT